MHASFPNPGPSSEGCGHASTHSRKWTRFTSSFPRFFLLFTSSTASCALQHSSTSLLVSLLLITLYFGLHAHHKCMPIYFIHRITIIISYAIQNAGSAQASRMYSLDLWILKRALWLTACSFLRKHRGNGMLLTERALW